MLNIFIKMFIVEIKVKQSDFFIIYIFYLSPILCCFDTL